jgi:hypothetical protein
MSTPNSFWCVPSVMHIIDLFCWAHRLQIFGASQAIILEEASPAESEDEEFLLARQN